MSILEAFMILASLKAWAFPLCAIHISKNLEAVWIG
jgi:hypothetical protein